MRGKAIKSFLNWVLKTHNFQLEQKKCLEMFARDGSWQTKYFTNDALYAEAWEVDVAYAKLLKSNLPNCDLIICDSIKRSKNTLCDFDLIVADNPQNLFGEKNIYCEHFDLLPYVKNLFKKNTWLVFNINRKPFDIEKNYDWELRRKSFYNIKEVNNISKDFFHIFYKNYFEKHGLNLEVSEIFDRNKEYLSYFVCYLSRKKEI